MPSNIEIKARLPAPAATRALAASISDTPPEPLRQRDTFFRCDTGRLKLRELGSGAAELVAYARPDSPGAKQSDYEITPVADPDSLRADLSRALGVTHVVEKTRLVLPTRKPCFDRTTPRRYLAVRYVQKGLLEPLFLTVARTRGGRQPRPALTRIGCPPIGLHGLNPPLS